MNLTIVSREKKPLLSREDVTATVEFTGASTPKRMQIRDELAQKLGADPKMVALAHIENTFGSASLKVTAHVYANEQAMKTVSYEHFGMRDRGEKKKAEEKKEEKAEEKKA